MQAIDGRALSREALHERQWQIVRGFKRGQSKAAIRRDLGVRYSAVCRTLDRYERAGGRWPPASRGVARAAVVT